jgi:hypothetical protein
MSARSPSRKPLTWLAYLIRGAKAEQLGHVKALDADRVTAVASAEFGVPATRILVRQVGSHA